MTFCNILCYYIRCNDCIVCWNDAYFEDASLERKTKGIMYHKLPIPSRFLFRMELPCYYTENPDAMTELPEKYEFPDFATLEEYEGNSGPSARKGSEKTFRVRGAWNERGLVFQFFITGKVKSLWCTTNRPEESDRIELWLDTRNVRNVHRATRFCHRFFCLPAGGGDDGNAPSIIPTPINRAKQLPSEIPNGAIQCQSKILKNAYSLFVFFPAEVLTGFDTAEFQEMGIAWALMDRDLNVRTLTAGAPFPYTEDPSLWYTIHFSTK